MKYKLIDKGRKMIKKYCYVLGYVSEIMKSFWSASVSILWAFIPILLLGSYKIELLEISHLLLQLRIVLYQNWTSFWIAFFVVDLIVGIQKINKALSHKADKKIVARQVDPRYGDLAKEQQII